ncbi:MAG TPA: YifB family Mg chelatase-like AAA ATPase [Steroidobacteraceae bacterium]|nr:YifB family Mg chelatase-like AAA ATPase [Steroidobacteraceae bacterium]
MDGSRTDEKTLSLARIACRAQIGLEAPLVQVEVNLGSGLPMFCIVGLPETVVKESKERVRAALLNSRFEFPAGRITVNLAPADLPKEGGRFDLPIAMGILIASQQIKPTTPTSGIDTATEFYGELGLGGELRPTSGLLLAAAHASRHGHELIVPRTNAHEALVSARTTVRAADHLLEVCAHVEGKQLLAPLTPLSPTSAAALSRSCVQGGRTWSGHGLPNTRIGLDLRDVRGQVLPKRALVIAAAGEHSLLMVGPPGSGKSMLAQRLAELLPPLTESEALEVASIASVSASGFNASEFGQRPFRSPHHSASAAALVGGGSRARPGEISLAHRGVLFLDELPEFKRAVLEALREPLEAGVVSVSRAALQMQYPAAFQLIAAMNPCPCGRYGDPSGNCRCTPAQVQRYSSRISGPLLDRMDMHVEVPRVEIDEFDEAMVRGESTATAARRIARARDIQIARQSVCNARLADAQVERVCAPDKAGRGILELSMKRLGFTARARQRILKLARTIADLDEEPTVSASHVSQAVMLRYLDRNPSIVSLSDTPLTHSD